MNPKTVYAKINEVIKSPVLDEATSKKLLIAFEDILDDCKREIIEQNAKLQGGSSKAKRMRAALRYLKLIDNDRLRFAWQEKEYQCFTNGYTGFLLTNKLEGLDEAETSDIKLTEIIPQYNHYQEINLDICDVKLKLEIYKAEHKGQRRLPPCMYIIDEHYFKAQYILDCYEILGGNIRFFLDKKSLITPAVLESENGKAIICPVRPPKKT